MARRKPSKLNALIAVNKPAGMTSHDVVGRVRRAVGERRVGHAGTLDPMATGVMVVGIGQATRLLGLLTLEEKRYVAQIRFGAETTTDDIEGEITRQVEAGPELFDRSFAEGALEKLLGESLQVPPSYSAISVDGVRSYKRARAGESFELAPRPIRVDAALLLSIDSADGFPVWTVAFQVSKGTYIRALARDLGRSVSSAAHLTSLMRTASGSVAIDSCISLDDLTSAAVSEGMLDPVALLRIPAMDVSESAVEGILCGKRVAVAGVDIVEGTTLALVRAGKLLACAVVKDGYAYPRDVFPQPIEGVRS